MGNKDYSYKGWAEAFTIFYKYEQKEHGPVSCEHDIIYAGPNPEMVSAEDLQRLEELDWLPDNEVECFYNYI